MHFILFSASQYFFSFYTICVIVSQESRFKPTFKETNIFSFSLNVTESSSKNLYKQGVEAGCQGFVISDKVFGKFLDNFYDIFDDCIQVYPNRSLIVYQENMEERIENGWKYSKAIKGAFMQMFNVFRNIFKKAFNFFTDLPNILFIDYHKENFMFEFYTTNFVGNENSENLSLLAFAAVDDNFEEILSHVNLFPDKTANLQGKDVTLALFNYLPYVLWKEVVSKR